MGKDFVRANVDYLKAFLPVSTRLNPLTLALGKAASPYIPKD
jgi:hypothetical protein